MNTKIKKLLDKELHNHVIIYKAGVSYSGVRIVDFRTKHSNGKDFKHSNGDKYGLAFLNAFTEMGIAKIIEVMDSYPNTSIPIIKKVIEENRLKKYIHRNTQTFLQTKTGDEGQLYMGDLNDYSTVNFANLTAIRSSNMENQKKGKTGISGLKMDNSSMSNITISKTNSDSKDVGIFDAKMKDSTLSNLKIHDESSHKNQTVLKARDKFLKILKNWWWAICVPILIGFFLLIIEHNWFK